METDALDLRSTCWASCLPPRTCLHTAKEQHTLDALNQKAPITNCRHIHSWEPRNLITEPELLAEPSHVFTPSQTLCLLLHEHDQETYCSLALVCCHHIQITNKQPFLFSAVKIFPHPVSHRLAVNSSISRHCTNRAVGTCRAFILAATIVIAVSPPCYITAARGVPQQCTGAVDTLAGACRPLALVIGFTTIPSSSRLC